MEIKRRTRKLPNLNLEGVAETFSILVKGMALIYVMLFTVTFSYGQIQQAADSAINVLETGQLSEVDKLKTLFNICANTTSPDQQIRYAEQLILQAQKLHNSKYIILGYNYLGSAHKLKGNLSEALKLYLKAAEVASVHGDYVSQADAYTNAAGVYTSNEEYSKSLRYYNDALQLYTSKVDSQRLAVVYINYGYAAYKASLLDSAIALSKKAIYFSEYSEYTTLKAYAQANLALALAKNGNFDEAELQLNASMAKMEINQDHYGLADCLIEIGGIYLEKGDIASAIERLTRGYDIAKAHGLKEQVKNAANFLFRAYQKEGQLDKALAYQSTYYTYRDSLINAEQIRKLADLQTAYEVGQKQAEVDLLTAEKRAQQIIIFSIAGGAVLILILLGLVYKNYRDKHRVNRILEDQKQQLEALNSTKDRFFSIISHDLRGPVSAFYGLSRLIKFAIESKDSTELEEIADSIDETVDHLSGLLDNLLTWAMQQQGQFTHIPEKLRLSTVFGEIKGIFDNMASAKNITLSISLPDELIVWVDVNTTMTIFRNLVNNALKFTPEGGKVTLQGIQHDGVAQIKVSDTGVGMTAEQQRKLFALQGRKTAYGTAGEKGLGLGLQLVHEFVEMNNGSIEVDSQVGKGTTFIISLPLFESSQQPSAKKVY